MTDSGDRPLRDLFDLTGRVALVTGGSRGLGKEMATGLAEAGARIALVARRREWLDPTVEELRARGFACDGHEGDVSVPEDVDAVVRAVVERFGRVDILVNGAGIAWGAPALDMPLDKWRQVMEVNVTGTFLMCQRVGRQMVSQGGGTIVNVASVGGLVGCPPEVLDTVGYGASKGAVVLLTRDLAVKWARYGIRVNAIAPGFFPTRLSQGTIERNREEILRRTPLGRLGRPGEIKGVCVFLASDAAAYVTGQVLAVDGGMTAG